MGQAMAAGADAVRIFVCGDVVDSQESDRVLCCDDVAGVIAEADYAVCNFEGPLKGGGRPEEKPGCHMFQDKASVSRLKRQGFGLLLLANNHMLDYGRAGLEATIREIADQQLDAIGAGLSYEEAYQPLRKTIGGLTIGFINACEAQFGVMDRVRPEGRAGYAWINHSQIDKHILELRRVCDYVLVFPHAGLENVPVPLARWRERYRHFCDLGADCVIGSHPHVPQGYEQYGRSWIVYSLGNFCFNSMRGITGEDRSYSVLVSLCKDKPITFEVVRHHKEEGRVRLSGKDRAVDVGALNEMLAAGYEDLVDDISLTVYEKTLRPHLSRCVCPLGYNGSIKSTIKHLLMKGRQGKQTKRMAAMLMLHLVKNESYRFACERALEVVIEGRPSRSGS